jgi:hypothetical protein
MQTADEDSSMPSPSGTNQGLKWLRRGALAVATLALLYLAVAFALSRFLDPEALAAWLEPRMEEAVGREVDVGRVEVGFFPLSVRLREVEVADPTGMAPRLARVGSLEFQVAILPLLRREVEVARLVVDAFEADLRVAADGDTNFGDLSTRPLEDPAGAGDAPGEELPPSPEDPGAPAVEEEGGLPFALNLRSIRVGSSRVAYAHEGDSLAAEIGDLGLRASVRGGAGGAWALEGSSQATATVRKGVAAPILDGVAVGLTFDLEADEDLERVEIRTGELILDRIRLTLSGRVEDLQDPVRRLALELRGEELPLPRLIELLPDSVRRSLPVDAHGMLAANFRVEGEAGPGRLPDVTGRVTLAGGRVTLEGRPLAEALTADLELSADRSVRTRAQATVLEGPLSVEGRVALGNGGGMDLTLRADPDLALAGTLADLPEGATLSGRLPTEVRVTGPLDDLQRLRFDGVLRPTAIRATLPDLAVPVEVPEGVVQLAGTRATFHQLPLALGEDRFTLSGEVADLMAFMEEDATPQLRGEMRGARLDMTKLSTRPLADSSLTYGIVAFAKVGGRRVGTMAVDEAAEKLGLARPASLPLAGELWVALDTVLDRQGRMEEVRAWVDFGPDFLRVPEASIRRYGGEIHAAADLSLGEDPSAPFSLSLQVRDLDAAAFLSETTPLGRLVRGRLTLELDLVGTLDGFLLPDRPTLVGSGRWHLENGGLASTPLTQSLATFLGMEALREPSIRDWGTSFVLENGWLRLADATVEGAPGTPQVGGSLGLDGALDLRSAFTIPIERLSTSALERLGVAGQIAASVAQRPEVVQAILRIGGSVFDPSLQADPRSTASTLGQAIQEEVRSEVAEQIEAQQAEAQRRIEEQKEQLQERATGFFRGLLQRRDTTTTPPPPPPLDTLRPDTLRPDTVWPDTTRPDTVRPDTVRPDTTRPDTVRPDTTRPDTVRPDSLRPDTVRPDTTRPDTVASGRISSGTTGAYSMRQSAMGVAAAEEATDPPSCRTPVTGPHPRRR